MKHVHNIVTIALAVQRLALAGITLYLAYQHAKSYQQPLDLRPRRQGR